LFWDFLDGKKGCVTLARSVRYPPYTQRLVSLDMHRAESARWERGSNVTPELWALKCWICFVSPLWHT